MTQVLPQRSQGLLPMPQASLWGRDAFGIGGGCLWHAAESGKAVCCFPGKIWAIPTKRCYFPGEIWMIPIKTCCFPGETWAFPTEVRCFFSKDGLFLSKCAVFLSKDGLFLPKCAVFFLKYRLSPPIRRILRRSPLGLWKRCCFPGGLWRFPCSAL